MAILACIALSATRNVRHRSTVVAFASANFSSRSGSSSTSNTPPTNRRPLFSNSPPLAMLSGKSNNANAMSFINRKQQMQDSSLMSTAAVGDKATTAVTHPSFEIVEESVVEEYGAACTMYRHKTTGAELMSVQNDDDNKVFGIAFRTPPTDSTGVAHILEHSVLCGSKKYTTKEPFVQLLQGSLQTFLNAFTYPDRTCYVLASQNEKDFYNMVNVYADAVFHPRATLDPSVHAQEGWHLELDDKDQPLTYKGVVYNEMKGVYSSPDSLLNRQSQQAMFPDNTYGVDSGGDPLNIPDLSFEDFVQFHSKFYHPANSRIFFWGDDDVKDRLNIMDEYLQDFGPSPESKPGSVIEWQPKSITEPQWTKSPYPVTADGDKTHMVMVNWLVNDTPFTATDEITIGILDHLLMGTAQSTLYKRVIESGLGSAVTGGGLSDELLQATFAVGLKGVQPDNTEQVQTLILDTLNDIVKEGFSDDDIASAMNTVEFRLREFNTGSFPKGLSFMLGAMSKWIYDGSPTDALRFETPLAELKDRIAKDGSKVFTDFMQEYLVDNTHRVTVEMVPSSTLEDEVKKEEEDRLISIKESLSDDDLSKIIEDTSTLRASQATEDSPEDRNTIPSLQLSDLKRTVNEYPTAVTENENGSGVTVLRHEMSSTSGIAYVNFAVDVSQVPFEDVPLISLFTRIMTETGAGDLSDVDLSQRIGIHTGGVNANLSLRTVRADGVEKGTVHGCDHMLSKVFIGGKATADKAGELFSIYQLILTEANLDSQKKVIEMLKESKVGLESSIQGSGHSFSNTRMKSRYSVSSYIGEQMTGITYLDTVSALIKDAENDWPSVLQRLTNIRNIMLNEDTSRNGMMLDITGDKAVLDQVQPAVDSFLNTIPGNPNGAKLQDFYNTPHPWTIAAKAEMADNAPLTDEGFVVPTQVSYVGKALRLYEDGEKIPGSSAVVSRYLRTGYLWDHVRVIGGAYGGMCTFDAKAGDGVFTFVSYRDPNLDVTLDVYDKASDALLESAHMLDTEDVDGKELATAIIGTVGDMDGALSPDQKGAVAMNRYLSRETPEERLAYREAVLNTKPSDFKAFAERLKMARDSSVAVVSSAGAFEAAAKAGKVMEIKNIV